MISEMNILLSVIIIALGLIGIILSFLVVDKTKNLAALVISGLIIITGIFHYASLKISRLGSSRRAAQIRKMIPPDIDRLKKNLEPAKTGDSTTEKSRK
ncbi:MAG: hypothetical protein ABII74_06135 [Elusimicrobiota bacterium]